MKVFTTNNESVYKKQWKCLQQMIKVFTTNNESVSTNNGSVYNK